MKRILIACFLAASAAGGANLGNGPTPVDDFQTNDGTAYASGWSWNCTQSASPLPGWRNCPGTVTVVVPKRVQSGVISVYFNYPDSGAFFHGQKTVGTTTAPGYDDAPACAGCASAKIRAASSSLDWRKPSNAG